MRDWATAFARLPANGRLLITTITTPQDYTSLRVAVTRYNRRYGTKLRIRRYHNAYTVVNFSRLQRRS